MTKEEKIKVVHENNPKLSNVVEKVGGLLSMLHAHDKTFGAVVNSDAAVEHLEEAFTNKEKGN